MDLLENERDDMVAVLRLTGMCVIPYALRAAVVLGIPGVLVNAASELTVEEIAKLVPTATGDPVDATNLDRLLRFLAIHGLLREFVREDPGNPGNIDRRYGASGVMKLLHTDGQGRSLVPSLMMHLDSVFISTLQYLHCPILDSSVEPHVVAHGKSSFDWASTNQRFDQLFNSCMSSHSSLWIDGFLEIYQGFGSVQTLVDVGGGTGTILSAIVSKYPYINGINFDQPHVVKTAPQYPGIEHVGGNFFESVPECDAVFMKWILHDWNDDACLTILKNIKKALRPGGKIINVDGLLPESSEVNPEAKLNFATDLLMMAYNSGGKERTLTQFRVLAAKAGFARVEVVSTVDNFTVLEFFQK